MCFYLHVHVASFSIYQGYCGVRLEWQTHEIHGLGVVGNPEIRKDGGEEKGIKKGMLTLS